MRALRQKVESVLRDQAVRPRLRECVVQRNPERVRISFVSEEGRQIEDRDVGLVQEVGDERMLPRERIVDETVEPGE